MDCKAFRRVFVFRWAAGAAKEFVEGGVGRRHKRRCRQILWISAKGGAVLRFYFTLLYFTRCSISNTRLLAPLRCAWAFGMEREFMENIVWLV
jgi:hypothetical protein